MSWLLAMLLALIAADSKSPPEPAVLLRLLPHPGEWNEFAPEWFPDNRRLLFSSNRGGDGTKLYTVDIETEVVRPFFHKPGNWTFGRPSPDGTRIACVSDRSGRDSLWILDADTGAGKRMTTGGRGGFERISWSPDGKRIVFAWDGDGHGQQLWLLDLESATPHKLTTTKAANTAPDWSPDGEWIAFMSRRNSSPDLYKVKPDGTELTRLTSETTLDWWPSWSPNGKSIYYWSGWKFDFNLKRISADGSSATTLTDRRDWNWCPSVSPSGETIAFDSRHDGHRGIWVAKPDGTEARKLTNRNTSDFVDVARSKGVGEALARHAYSRRIDPDADYVTNTEVRMLLRTLLDRAELSGAVRLAEWNLQRDPKSIYASDLLLEAHRRAGRSTPIQALEIVNAFREGSPEKAWRLYDTSLAGFPSWNPVPASWLTLLAREAHDRGEILESRRILERTLSAYPDFEAARALLDQLTP